MHKVRVGVKALLSSTQPKTTTYRSSHVKYFSFFFVIAISFFSMIWRFKVMMELKVKVSLRVLYSTQNPLAEAYAKMRISSYQCVNEPCLSCWRLTLCFSDA